MGVHRPLPPHQFLLIIGAILAVAGACTQVETVEPILDAQTTPVVVAATETALPAATTALPTTAPSATAPPTAEASPAPATSPTQVPSRAQPICGPSRTHRRFDVINVADDDPDGGLVVHSEPGASAPVTGVLAPFARGIWYSDQCAVAPDGGEWWAVQSGETWGWVNAFYLGQRLEIGDRFDEQPCRSSGVDIDLAGLPSAPAPIDAPVVSDVRYLSSPSCDRVIFEFADGWEFRGIAEPMGQFTRELARRIEYGPGEVTVVLASNLISPLTSSPPRRAWRDASTDEQNVALAFDRDDETVAYVGFGNGRASVHVADNPARLIVDITQHGSASAEVVGPIASPNGEVMLFEPLQTLRTGPGTTEKIRLRGWSFGFESNSTIEIRPWTGGDTNHPRTWTTEILGPDATETPTGSARRIGRDGVEGELRLPVDHFIAPGHFDFEITLTPGSYQLLIAPDSGIGCGPMVGQQFRVAEPDADINSQHPAAVPFSVSYEFVDTERGVEDPGRLVRRTIEAESERWTTDQPCIE